MLLSGTPHIGTKDFFTPAPIMQSIARKYAPKRRPTTLSIARRELRRRQITAQPIPRKSLLPGRPTMPNIGRRGGFTPQTTALPIPNMRGPQLQNGAQRTHLKSAQSRIVVAHANAPPRGSLIPPPSFSFSVKRHLGNVRIVPRSLTSSRFKRITSFRFRVVGLTESRILRSRADPVIAVSTTFL